MLPDFAHADWMVWTHAATIEALQHAYNGLRRTCPLGRAITPVWSSAAVHRPAEFNKTHVPAFLAGGHRVPICAYIPSSAPMTGICCTWIPFFAGPRVSVDRLITELP